MRAKAKTLPRGTHFHIFQRTIYLGNLHFVAEVFPKHLLIDGVKTLSAICIKLMNV